MSNKTSQMHDTTLTFRLPKTLHAQLEQVATAQYLKMGELVRNLIKEEIKRALPYVNTPNQTPTKPINPYELSELRKKQAMSPQERRAYEQTQVEDDWA